MTIMRFKQLITLATFIGGTCLGQPSVQINVVKNSPFSAQVVVQSTQVLADGNRITHQATAFIARDSEGRTRREQTPTMGSGSVVFIQDPVAGVVHVLETQSHTARKIVVAQADSTGLPAQSRATDPMVALGPSAEANVKSERLGTQFIEGVLVEGTRITRTVPAGLAGNERSIEIEVEAWNSPELHTIIMNKTTDPRVGQIVYKLTDIQRAEPSHSLFEVPADYTIRNEHPADSQGVEKLQNK